MDDSAKFFIGWACRTAAMFITITCIHYQSWRWLGVAAFLFVESIGWEIKRLNK